MRKRFFVLVMIVGFVVVALITGCNGNGQPAASNDATPTPPGLSNDDSMPTVLDIKHLKVKKVGAIPKIDGNPNKPQWQQAGTVEGNNGSSIKGIYTDDEVAFLYTIFDPTLSIVTPDCWYFDGEKFILWRDYCDQNDIKIPYGTYDMFNMVWETGEFDMEGGGCLNFCHTDDDGKERHVVPPGASADMWVLLNKHGYGPMCTNETGFPLGYLGISQTGEVNQVLTGTSNPFQVTSGTFNFIGWADERIQTSFDNPDFAGKAKATETGEYCLLCHTTQFVEGNTLQGKLGKMPYRRNAVGYENMYMTAPKYIKPNPKNYADAAVITDKDIADGTAVSLSTLSDAEIKNAWAKYEELNCLVPELILQEPSGNMAQTLVGAQWSDGVWTVEVKRALTTNNPHDIQFDDLDKQYVFSTAIVLGVEDGTKTPSQGFGSSSGIAVTFD